MMRQSIFIVIGAGLLLAVVFGLSSCDKPTPEQPFVAKVGEAFLLDTDLAALLAIIPANIDSAAARKQVVDDWVTSQLLFQEAIRRGLDTRADVKKRLKESDEAVLITALINDLYNFAESEATPEDIRLYYEKYKEQLVTREDYSNILLLSSASSDSISVARRMVQRALLRNNVDSVWQVVVNRFASNPDLSQVLSENFFPESIISHESVAVATALKRLRKGQMAPVIKSDSVSYLLYLIERVPAGETPKLPWVEDEIQERLLIQRRKQQYARHVQDLRAEATAKSDLIIQ